MLSGNSKRSRARGLLRPREHDAGLRGQREADGIDLANAVQARERQQDLAALAVERRRAAAVARVAALRHDADARVVTDAHDGRAFLDEAGRTTSAAAP